jgi:hypothetical protein
MRWSHSLGLVVGLWGWASSSCAPSGFPSATLITSVRILASRADQPYAKPASTVNVQVLAYDGRANQTAPMTITWLPFVCENPPGDAYYACFEQAARGGRGADAGAEAGIGAAGGTGFGGGLLQPGVDLTPFLVNTGPTFRFTMPADVVTAHSANAAMPVKYGLAILFNMACAGHLELVPLDPNNVQAPPFGCFDEQHNRLGANDYVFGFTRVYAYDDIQNANPVIDYVDVEGQRVDLQRGFQVESCPAGSHCAGIHVGPVVPPDSQEVDPAEKDANGNPLKELIWAEFFSTFGSFNNDVRLLYDAKTGSVGGPSDTDNQFQPPDQPGDGTIWVVVHDNRGGVSWASVPVHVVKSL